MNMSPRNGRVIFGAACAAALLAVALAYGNHFHNSFHFDDSHTVVENPAIRTLANVPGFFTDGRTFSVLPANASYRPLVSATLALDYWLAGGLNPLWFHISTFIWFLAQLAMMYLLFVRIARSAGNDDDITPAHIVLDGRLDLLVPKLLAGNPNHR